MKSTRKRKGKNRKISSKIAVITTFMLIIVFTILTLVTALSTQNVIQTVSFSQLRTLSNLSAEKIQGILKDAQTISSNMASYMIDNSKDKQLSQSATDPAYESRVFPKVILHTKEMKMENYLMSTIKSAVMGSEEIVGCGILFAPYSMSKQLGSYSLYAGDDGMVRSFGDYAEYSKQSYYKEALVKRETIFTAPYDYEGISMITAAAPIIVENKVVAVAVTDIEVAQFQKASAAAEQYQSIYSSIIKEDGTIVYESLGQDMVGQSMFDMIKEPNALKQAKEKMALGEAFYIETPNWQNKMEYKFYNPIEAGEANWYAVTSVTISDVNKAAVNMTVLVVFISITALVVIIAVILYILKKVINPIHEVVTAASKIADGNLDIVIETKSEDEIGQMAEAFRHTVDFLKEIIGDISSVLNHLSENHLDVDTTAEFKGDFLAMEKSVKRIITDLNDVISQIITAADQVSSGSDQVSSSAQALSQGTTEQASAVEELAAEINEISQQVKNNAQNSVEASQKAELVGNEIVESNSHMSEMIQAMEEINSSSKKISNIIKTIEDIAFQTNILALNAAVEAARAGAAGKGFAVVADEVRNLASKSAEAAKETTVLIEGSVHCVENGTKIAAQTAQSLSTVVEGAKEVAAIVNRISSASKAQAQSIIQINQGVDQIAGVVQNNSATAQQSAAASEQLNGQAQLLKQLVDKFYLKQ